jgi:transposase
MARPATKGKQVTELAMARVALPAYAPELNPAERVFEALRAR